MLLQELRHSCISPLLVYMVVVGLYGTVPDIPSGGIEGYKEARAYIAADAASHPERKPVMLNNAPGNAQYYRFPVLPSYSENKNATVLYVYNDIFDMHEIEMYKAVREAGIEDSDMIKILFDCKYPRRDRGFIFKKYLR